MEKKLFFNHPAGVKLCGVLNDVNSDHNTPVIIVVHGFTSSKDSKSYIQLLENLANAGIATFRIDLYGHGESGGEFRKITISKGRDSILAAIDYLKSLGYSKIGLLGSSFGGISAIMATAQSDNLFCLALKSPVTDWLDLAFPSQPELLDKWKNQGFIDYSDHGDKYLKLDYAIVEDAKNQVAFSVANKITIPTLILQGDEDEIVPIEGSQKFTNMLKNGKLHTVVGSNHNYSSSPEHFAEMTRVLSDFLIKKSQLMIGTS